VKNTRSGLAFAVAAFCFWGLTPLFFKLLQTVPPFELLAHRVVWSALFLGLWFALWKRQSIIAMMKALKPYAGWLVLSAFLITVNWFLYLYAVITDQVLAASLGYFFNPLLNIAFGVLLLKEELNGRQKIATVLACIAVANEAIQVGDIPWLAIMLPISFGLYGVIRKKIPVNAAQGLLAETLFGLPFAIAFMSWLAYSGQIVFTQGLLAVDIYLVLSGVVSVLPLLWFILGAQGCQLSTLGLLQYIAPSLMFLMAVFLFDEAFSASKLASFICIWIGLALVSLPKRFFTFFNKSPV
jgi:chloramphenicol-sensitive protein RarD